MIELNTINVDKELIMGFLSKLFGKGQPQTHTELISKYSTAVNSGGLETHLLILFNTPGPSNLAGDVGGIINYLKKEYSIKPLPECKVRTVVASISEVTDYKDVESFMTQWLNAEGGQDRFKILGRGAINAHQAQYRIAQATWATYTEKWNAQKAHIEDIGKEISESFEKKLKELAEQKKWGSE